LKGPRQKERQKIRMEVETQVEYEPAKRILELLEFRVKETYSKIREEYRFEGCAVCLDHIPNTGSFIEIEGSPKKISQIARALKLRGADREHRSYRKLISDAARARPQSARKLNGSSRL